MINGFFYFYSSCTKAHGSLLAVGLTLKPWTWVSVEIKGGKERQKPGCTGTIVTLAQHVTRCTCLSVSSGTGLFNLLYRIIISHLFIEKRLEALKKKSHILLAYWLWKRT